MPGGVPAGAATTTTISGTLTLTGSPAEDLGTEFWVFIERKVGSAWQAVPASQSRRWFAQGDVGEPFTFQVPASLGVVRVAFEYGYPYGYYSIAGLVRTAAKATSLDVSSGGPIALGTFSYTPVKISGKVVVDDAGMKDPAWFWDGYVHAYGAVSATGAVLGARGDDGDGMPLKETESFTRRGGAFEMEVPAAEGQVVLKLSQAVDPPDFPDAFYAGSGRTGSAAQALAIDVSGGAPVDLGTVTYGYTDLDPSVRLPKPSGVWTTTRTSKGQVAWISPVVNWWGQVLLSSVRFPKPAPASVKRIQIRIIGPRTEVLTSFDLVANKRRNSWEWPDSAREVTAIPKKDRYGTWVIQARAFDSTSRSKGKVLAVSQTTQRVADPSKDATMPRYVSLKAKKVKKFTWLDCYRAGGGCDGELAFTLKVYDPDRIFGNLSFVDRGPHRRSGSWPFGHDGKRRGNYLLFKDTAIVPVVQGRHTLSLRGAGWACWNSGNTGCDPISDPHEKWFRPTHMPKPHHWRLVVAR